MCVSGDDVMLSLTNFHLSHCEACIFPVQGLKLSCLYYTLLYHKKRNNMIQLTYLFVLVSLTRNVLSLY